MCVLCHYQKLLTCVFIVWLTLGRACICKCRNGISLLCPLTRRKKNCFSFNFTPLFRFNCERTGYTVLIVSSSTKKAKDTKRVLTSFTLKEWIKTSVLLKFVGQEGIQYVDWYLCWFWTLQIWNTVYYNSGTTPITMFSATDNGFSVWSEACEPKASLTFLGCDPCALLSDTSTNKDEERQQRERKGLREGERPERRVHWGIERS